MPFSAFGLHGVDEWLVEERNVRGIVERLVWLLENPDRWDSLLGFGRRHVEAEFDAVRQGFRLEAIYRSLLHE